MIKSGLSVVVSRPCDRKTSQERGTVLLWVVELGSIKTTLGAAFALELRFLAGAEGLRGYDLVADVVVRGDGVAAQEGDA